MSQSSSTAEALSGNSSGIGNRFDVQPTTPSWQIYAIIGVVVIVLVMVVTFWRKK